MASWRNRPKNISEINSSIPYIIAIDESGSPNLKYVKKIVSSNTEDTYDINNTHFNVTACLMKTSNFIESQNLVMGIKNKYWTEACADYNGDKRRVCFHSTEIRRRVNAFNFNKLSTYQDFINELSQIMTDMKVKLFSSHINKLDLVKEYSNPYDPYDLSLTFILERLSYEVGNKKSCYYIRIKRKKRG